MMKATLTAFTLLLALACVARAQASRPPFGLDAGALILETQLFEVGAVKKRMLVLWMSSPTKHPREEGETYTCPEETRGSYYSGPARVSLYDMDTRRVINTLKIKQEYADGADEFDIPYRIRAGGYYHVPDVGAGQEGRPTIMRLRDFNGDGRALEFALFDAQACMGLQTALFGYSEKFDRVVQYPVSLETTDAGGKKTAQVLMWVDYLFSKESAGRREYEVDYRGRGGTLDRYAVRYNPQAERFDGTVSHTPGQ